MLLQHTVSEKVKAFLAGLLDAGFRLIQSEPKSGDRIPRPLQCFRRVATAQNHEVVSVVDHTSLKLLSPFGDAPVLEKRFMYRFASIGLTIPPWGVPQRLFCPPIIRRFPFSSRSSTGTFNHILIR